MIKFLVASLLLVSSHSIDVVQRHHQNRGGQDKQQFKNDGNLIQLTEAQQAKFEPLTITVLATGIVALASAGVNAYRKQQASGFLVGLKSIQKNLIAESLSRCVQARVTTFQVKLFDTTMTYFVAHAEALVQHYPSQDLQPNHPVATQLQALSSQFKTIKSELSPILKQMTDQACNDDAQTTQTHRNNAAVVANTQERLKKISNEMYHDLTTALMASITLGLDNVLDGPSEHRIAGDLDHDGQDPISKVVASFSDGKGDLASDLTKALHTFHSAEEQTLAVRKEIASILRLKIHAYLKSKFELGPIKTFLEKSRLLIGFAASISKICGGATAVGAGLSTVATGFGLAVALWQLSTSVVDGFHENSAFGNSLTSARVNTAALSEHANYRQCVGAAGALDVGEKQHAMLHDYTALLEAATKDVPNVPTSVLANKVGHELKSHCRFHVHLCKTALVDDKRVWAAVKPILGEEFKDEMASRAMYGPITDFAVSMDSQQANALDAIGFELAFHKPIGASSVKYAGETHHKPIWLWQCRLCSSHAIASVVFVNSEHAVNGGNNLIAVGDGHFISFKKAGESLKGSYESDSLFATPILSSLDPQTFGKHFFDSGETYVRNDAEGRTGTVHGFFEGQGDPFSRDFDQIFSPKTDTYNPSTNVWSSSTIDTNQPSKLITAYEICHTRTGYHPPTYIDPNDDPTYHSVDVGRWYKAKNHAARSGDIFGSRESHIALQLWSVFATRVTAPVPIKFGLIPELTPQITLSTAQCTFSKIDVAEKQVVRLQVCDKTNVVEAGVAAQWMYVSCEQLKASNKWVLIEDTVKDPEWQEHRQDLNDPLRTAFALYGRLASREAPAAPGATPASETIGQNVGASWHKAKKSLQCEICNKCSFMPPPPSNEQADEHGEVDALANAFDYMGIGALGGSGIDAWALAAVQSPQGHFATFTLKNWWDGVGGSSCLHQEIPQLNDLIKTSTIRTLEDIQHTMTGFADGRLKQGTRFFELLTQLHQRNCRARFFVPIKHAGECKGTGNRPTVQLSEQGKIMESCSVASPLGPVYVIEVIFNTDNRGAKEPPVIQADDVKEAWESQWYVQPIEYTFGGPYEPRETTTPRSSRGALQEIEPAWNTYTFMHAQYYTLRLWSRMDTRMPRHYEKGLLCDGFDKGRDCTTVQ